MRLRDSLGARLSAVLGLAFGVIVAAAVIGFHRFHGAALEAQSLRGEWAPRIELLRELRLNAERAVLSGTRALQTTNFRHLAQIAAELRASEAAIDTLAERYAAAAGGEEERRLLRQFIAAWSTWRAGYVAIQRHLEAGDSRRAAIAYEELRAGVHAPALGTLEALKAHAEAQSAAAFERADRVFRVALLVSIAAFAIGTALAVAVILWTRRFVARPLRDLADALDSLAGGELDVVAPQSGRRDEIGALARAVAGYRDSLRRGAELAQEAERERERLRIAVANMPVGLCMTDAAGALVVSNRRFADTYAVDPALLAPGCPLPALPRPREASSGSPNGPQVVTLDNDRVIRVVDQPLPDGGRVAIHEDITAQRKAEARIAHMAHHDALTGLANRVRLREALEAAIGSSGTGALSALLYLDLDRFKPVNDTLGHAAGDELLQAVARRLREQVRPADLVARLGGDEFAVLLAGIRDPADAATLARRVVAVLGAPYDIRGQQVVIGASVGIAMAPADGRDQDALLRNADLALYRAKQEGRGTCRFFAPDMTARIQARRAQELDLRRALDRGEFELWYQPMVHLPGRTIRGFEALLRWAHPERGILLPGDFIALAEEVGLMVPIGAWVMRQACRDAAGWPGAPAVAVNISAAQCAGASLVGLVDDALSAAGLPSSRLEIEITEAAVLSDSASVADNLRGLRARGIGLVMDDFGTGIASISHLRRFPFDAVKIDRHFVAAATEATPGAEAAAAIAALCRSLGLSVTAEGVETEAQVSALGALCTAAQGYLFGRPVQAAEVRALLGDGRPGGHLEVVAA